jgi:hypothetical protein
MAGFFTVRLRDGINGMDFELVDRDHENGVVYGLSIRSISIESGVRRVPTLCIVLEGTCHVLLALSRETAREFALALVNGLAFPDDANSSSSTEMHFCRPGESEPSVSIVIQPLKYGLQLRITPFLYDKASPTSTLHIPRAYVCLVAQAVATLDAPESETGDYEISPKCAGEWRAKPSSILVMPDMIDGRARDECFPYPADNYPSLTESADFSAVRKRTKEWLNEYSEPPFWTRRNQGLVRRGIYCGYCHGGFPESYRRFSFCAPLIDSVHSDIGESDLSDARDLHHERSMTLHRCRELLGKLEDTAELINRANQEVLVGTVEICGSMNTVADIGIVTVKVRESHVILDFAAKAFPKNPNRFELPFHVVATFIQYFRALEYMYATVDDA